MSAGNRPDLGSTSRCYHWIIFLIRRAKQQPSLLFCDRQARHRRTITTSRHHHGFGSIPEPLARRAHSLSGSVATPAAPFSRILVRNMTSDQDITTGDAPVLAAAQDQIRHEFRQRSALDSSSSDTQAALQHADEVAKILRENVVQGKRAADEEATYSASTFRPSPSLSVPLPKGRAS